MKLEGFLEKEDGEKYWGVNIPTLGIYTQGRTKKEAYAMAKDSIELLVDLPKFSVKIVPSKGLNFYISSSNMAPLIGLLLGQKRKEQGLTIQEVAARMGSKSPTAYARYESGKVKASLDKLDQILKAINEDFEPIIKVG